MSPEQNQAVSPQAEQAGKKRLRIPKQTDPLGKFVRTGEGILVFAFNLAMLIVPIFSNALTPEQAVKWAGIVNGVAVVSRTGLKMVSVFEGVTGTTPADVVSKPVADDIDQLATAIAQNLPKDLATTPSIDQVGSQLEEVKGLLAALASDAGVSGGAAAALVQVAEAGSPPPAAAPPVQTVVSDDEELATPPTDAEIAGSLTATPAQQPTGAGQGATSAPVSVANAASAPASELLPSDDEELASPPTEADATAGAAASPEQVLGADGGQLAAAGASGQPPAGPVTGAIANQGVTNGGGQSA
ncbi:MAG: hypothetical protein ACXVFQ_01435 [Solirubrobacteraceae bacterium]